MDPSAALLTGFLFGWVACIVALMAGFYISKKHGEAITGRRPMPQGTEKIK